MPLEIIVGAAVGAAAATPSIRQTVRRGLVYGVSRALIAYDRVVGSVQNRAGASGTVPPGSPAAAGTPVAVGVADSPASGPVPDGKPVH